MRTVWSFFAELDLIAHSIISHAMYFIVLLLHGHFHYDTSSPVNMLAPTEQAKV